MNANHRLVSNEAFHESKEATAFERPRGLVPASAFVVAGAQMFALTKRRQTFATGTYPSILIPRDFFSLE